MTSTNLPATEKRVQDIRKRAKLFAISASITGIMLFFLYIVAAIRWFMHSDIWLFTQNGFISLIQLPQHGIATVPSVGINFTVWFLIVHGWLYVIYLLLCFALWSALRWPITRFLLIALAGTLVIVSFIVEAWAVRQAKTEADRIEQKGRAADSSQTSHE